MVSEGTKWMLYDVKNILNKYFKYIRFKGFVLVTRENSILLDEKYGNKIYRKSVLPFASLTKQFTAAAVNELISTTSVTLETSIYDIYCKKCQIGDVSIRNLLTMQSGIVDYLNDSLYKEKLIKIINLYDASQLKKMIIIDILNNNTKFKPGTKTNYSNSNYYLLGDIIERVTNMSFECYLNNTIFNDFDLKNTFFLKGNEIENDIYYKKNFLPYELTYSACGLYSTPYDFYKWVVEYLKFNIQRIIEEDYEYNWGLQIDKKKKVVSHSGATLTENMNFIYDYKNDILIYIYNEEAKMFDAYEITTNVYKIICENKV